MSIKHFVFTNFGVGIKDILWLAYRIELLLNITAQSLLKQKCKDFDWHIFFDEELPFIYKARLLNLAENSIKPKIYIHPVREYSEINQNISKIIKSLNIEGSILTSRIDDDDAININAFDLIHKAAIDSINVGNRVALIALTKGYEWLPTDRVFRKVTYDSLALGLSLLSSSNDKIFSITQLAHHQAFETLKKNFSNVSYLPIDINERAYLYTKHQLSDSYYVGSRARILQDKNLLKIDQVDLFDFGLDLEGVNFVRNIFLESPLGMPHKYLAKLADLKNELKKRLSSEEVEEDFDTAAIRAKIEWYQKNATRKNLSSKSGRARLAIIGSSATRDLFTHKKELIEKFEIVAYLSRQSVVGYTSLPCIDPVISNRITDLGFEDKQARWDMDKTHWEILESSRPDLIIIDFIDERLGLIFHQGSVVTPSGPILKAFQKSSIDFEIIRPWDVRAVKLRKWAVKEFLTRCYSIANNIIIHKANWANEYFDNDGDIKSFYDTEYKTLVGLNSSVLDEVFKLSESSDIPFEVIGGGEIMRAGGNHLWTFYPCHYDFSYYKQLFKDLLRRV